MTQVAKPSLLDGKMLSVELTKQFPEVPDSIIRNIMEEVMVEFLSVKYRKPITSAMNTVEIHSLVHFCSNSNMSVSPNYDAMAYTTVVHHDSVTTGLSILTYGQMVLAPVTAH